MTEIAPQDFAAFTEQARKAAGDAVYPLSVAEGRQSGRIFTHGDAVLFWHCCGFAYLSGRPDGECLRLLRERFFNADTRFLLITDDRAVTAYFGGDKALTGEPRIYYQGIRQPVRRLTLPESFTLRQMNRGLLERISGRIVPAFSWTGPEQFLRGGLGYCVTQGETVCAWAFTAAVTAQFADIGVETAPEYRRRGLAAFAAAALRDRILQSGRTPVWAHHAANTGSAKTAAALGFIKQRVCTAIRRSAE